MGEGEWADMRIVLRTVPEMRDCVHWVGNWRLAGMGGVGGRSG